MFGDDIYMIAPRLERSSVPGQENIWQGTFRTPENGGRIHFFLNDAVVPFEWVRAVSPNGQATSEVPSGFGGWTGAIDEVEELAIDVTAAVDAGDDIRARGEDQRAGTVAIRAGTRIRPAEIAVLAAGACLQAVDLGRRGAAVLSADAVVHGLYEQPEVIAAVRNRFGPEVLGSSGEVDRAALAERAVAEGAEAKPPTITIHPDTPAVVNADELVEKLGPA